MGSHRNLYYKFLKRELDRLFCEALRDRERAELVALRDYAFLGVERGDVILAPRYVHPSIAKLSAPRLRRGP